MKSLYKTPADKEAILKLYDGKLAELGLDHQSKQLDTAFGKTNVIITGKPSNPPIILVHGSNGCAPIALETYPTVYKNYQVFAIDVLAQPNKSAETRLSMKDNSYGEWANEVINQLGLKDVTMAGFSLGGLVILKTLIHNESNIKEVFLTAPAFIVNGNPFIAIFKIFIPMKRYISTQKSKYLEKFLSALFSQKDEFALKFLAKVFMSFDMDFSPVPTIKKAEAQAITTPITLIGAKQDIMFPGVKMLKRAKKIFPSLKHSLLLEDSKHVQTTADNRLIEKLILKE